MKRFFLIFVALVGVIALTGATTLITVQQIIPGAATGTFVITSVNGKVSWAAPTSATMINFSDEEIPSGTLNGINTSFTLLHAPLVGSLILTRNGLVQEANGIDYVLVGNSITFNGSTIPQSGDILQAWYRY